jgi:sugar lactone lactonase YvrE
MAATPQRLAGGLVFPEGPRWYDGRLWLSDMFASKVVTCTPDGTIETILDTGKVWPSGLGFLPDGSLVIATMQDALLVRWDKGSTNTLADLSDYGDGEKFWGSVINDMVIDGRGNLYVGVYGTGTDHDESGIVLRRMDGSVELVAEGIAIANGMVVTPDGRTLIIAELGSDHLSAFDVAEDGTLQNRRVFARVPGSTPDGVCLDAEGAVWFGSVYNGEFFRVEEGGKVLDRIEVDGFAIAPALGGPDRKTLYLLTADTSKELLQQGKADGFIEVVQVDVPGAGWP